MASDKKVLHLLSILSVAVLLSIILFAGGSGRIVAAILLLPLAAAVLLLIKKRSIFSINRHQVLLLMTVIGMLYVTLQYLSGLYFGFYRNGYGLRLQYILQFILPVTAIILTIELMRSVIRAQNSRLADVLFYLACVCAEVLIQTGYLAITNFNRFMDLLGLSVFPAIVSNLLYHYLSKRYGALPNIAYRLITTLIFYIVPYQASIPDSLLAFVSLIAPLLIYLFIDALYEKKRRYALGKKNIFSAVLTALAVSIMAAVIMLISNQFRFGALVIATESMTGELNKGDVAIFERYDRQKIETGQVIVYENGDSMVVHRVVDIQFINGTTRYFTQGDTNEAPDTGFVTDSRVVGLVKVKAPYVGYPTLWLRDLFSSLIGP